MANESDQLNTAICLYVGYGTSSFPDEDGARLLKAFGPELGHALEVKVNALLKELDDIKPISDSLVSASQSACGELKIRHPELNARGVAALEWIYSWWWK